MRLTSQAVGVGMGNVPSMGILCAVRRSGFWVGLAGAGELGVGQYLALVWSTDG